MHRFFVPPEDMSQDLITLTGETHHHLRTVLRLRPLAEILLLDGRGQICRCRLERTDGQSSLARVQERWWEAETALPVKLLQGLPKGEKMAQILQKGTEMGLTEFQPVLTEHCALHIPADRQSRILQRWEVIVREAARQSGRPILPVVRPLAGLSQALSACREEFRLVLWEKATTPLVDAMPAEKPGSVVLLIGPEGGLSAAEAALAEKYHFIPVRLGPRILRTETAGWAVAAILQHCFGDLNRTEGCRLPPPPGR